jgi:hypothetical protein
MNKISSLMPFFDAFVDKEDDSEAVFIHKGLPWCGVLL